jgi:hypothetical protein
MSNEAKTPDYFLAILLLSVAIVVTSGTQLFNSFQQRSQLKKSLVQAAAAEKQAVAVSNTLQGLSRDLVGLSATSNGAKQIVQEFGIRINNPAPAKK